MMQTAAAAVAMAAAWQTEQRATCDSTRLWRRQLGQVFRTATSAVFFLPLPLLLFSIVFSFFVVVFVVFLANFSLFLCVCVASGWRCGSCLAKGFPFSKRTHLHSQHFAEAAAAVYVIVCVWESVCASLCQWQRGVCLFFLRTVGHFWQTQQQQQQRRLRVQPTIDGTAIL